MAAPAVNILTSEWPLHSIKFALRGHTFHVPVRPEALRQITGPLDCQLVRGEWWAFTPPLEPTPELDRLPMRRAVAVEGDTPLHPRPVVSLFPPVFDGAFPSVKYLRREDKKARWVYHKRTSGHVLAPGDLAAFPDKKHGGSKEASYLAACAHARSRDDSSSSAPLLSDFHATLAALHSRLDALGVPK